MSKDDPDYVETVLDEDCQLNLCVESCLIELEQFSEEQLCSKSAKREPTSEPSDILGQMQEKMHKLMLSQMEQHNDLLETIAQKR